MAQTTDIVLNSAGYMVQPGTYKRLQDGMAEGRTERISLTDFFGGQNRAIQLERDKVWGGVGVGPTLGGQGVTPWGKPTVVTNQTLPTKPDKDTPIPYVIIRDRLYFAIGSTIYAGPYTYPGGAYGMAELKTFADPIVDICIYNSVGMLVSFGNAADIVYYRPGQAEVVLFAGERGNVMEAYAGHAAWSDSRTGGRPTVLRLVSGSGFDERAIDYDPIAMLQVGAELMVVTKQALYTFTGRVKEVQKPNSDPPVWIHEWSGEWSPFFQQGVINERDDFKMLLGYGGKTIAWIAGGVHELVPSGDRAGWRSTGLSGVRCFGGCVAAGYVIVSIEADNGNNELWAYDGNGWWKLATQAMTAPDGVWCWPMPIAGAGSQRGSFAVMHHGSQVNTYFTLADMDGVYACPSTGELITPLIDAAERDKAKAWRKIGAVFATPELRGKPDSNGATTMRLDYSLDGGATWVDGADAEGTRLAIDNPGIRNTMANNNFALEGALSGAVSTFLMLRIRWYVSTEWAPILVGLWAEYEVLDNPARRRKWEFKVHARDQEITRNGSAFTRTGRQLIHELWDSWENDTTIPFRDIDYDDDATQRNVRIVGISEAVNLPSDSAEWGDSEITLKLVEV